MAEAGVKTDEQEKQEETVNKNVISSGNTELDSRIGGGLPLGSLALIEGASGTGKSVLSQQIAYGALQQGLRVVMFTSENTVRSMVKQMDTIDMSVLDFLLIRRLRVYPVEFSQGGQDSSKYLLNALNAEENADLFILDSLSVVAGSITSSAILQFFEEAKQLCDQGKTIMVTLHPQAPALMEQLRSLCDANLVLETERDGQKLVKMLTVAKIRGASSVTGAIVGFDVEPGWGMRVIPISKARG
ncbi:MAG: flagellar accessory protein FlaH [Anaerolineaceae bacterium]|nr:flagellar accessory protein FlaH [Anaerolineaceae bacterium]